MKQKNLWITVGPPGCGKSTWVQNQIKKDGGSHVSRDAVRNSILKEGEPFFSRENQVFNVFAERIKANLSVNDNVYADATHLSEPSRRKLINALTPILKDIDVNCVNFCIPLQTCLDRNAKREGNANVPEKELRHMYAAKTNPAFDEFKYNKIIDVTLGDE